MKSENSPPDDTSPSLSPDPGPQPCARCGCACCRPAPQRSELISVKLTLEEVEEIIRTSLRYVHV